MSLISERKKVFACVDLSAFAGAVAEAAGWAAERIERPVQLLHIIDKHPERAQKNDDHSGALGIDAQEHLLTDLTVADEEKSKKARERGRIFLANLQETLRLSVTVPVDIKQRFGELEHSLSEQQDTAELFVIGRRGRSAEMTQRDLGRNLERLVRALNRPVLVIPETFSRPTRALFAFDGSAIAKRGIRILASSKLLRDTPIDLVHAGASTRSTQDQLEWALNKLEKRGFNARAEIINGDPETVIAREMDTRSANFLIMGAYSHSPLRSLFFGSKTSGLLRASRVSTLLIR